LKKPSGRRFFSFQTIQYILGTKNKVPKEDRCTISDSTHPEHIEHEVSRPCSEIFGLAANVQEPVGKRERIQSETLLHTEKNLDLTNMQIPSSA
jgi:hypothetical protein